MIDIKPIFSSYFANLKNIKLNNIQNIVKNKGTRFYLIYGDEGIIFIRIDENNKLAERHFIENVTEEKNIEFLSENLRAFPHYKVYILVDIVEQNYQLQNFPPVSRFLIDSLANKKLMRSFDETYIKASLKIAVPDKTQREWQYLFISMPFTHKFENFMNFIRSFDNKLDSILFTSVEATTILDELILSEHGGAIKNNQYNMLIIHNKVSGVRQILFKNQKLLFTRLIHIDEQEYFDVVAGTIIQEIKNSFEYLNRNYNIDYSKINVIGIFSEHLNKSLLSQYNLTDNKLFLTPYQVANYCKLDEGILREDRYSDVLTSLAINKFKPQVKFNSNKGTLLNNLLIAQFVQINLIICFSILCCYKLIDYSINSYVNKVALEEQNKKALNLESLIRKRKQETAVDSKENNLIVESVSAFNNITANKFSPKDLIYKFYEDNEDDIVINEINWRTNKVENSSFNSNVNVRYQTYINFKVNFINKGKTYQDLFSNFERFINKLQKKFENYKLEYSRINQQIDLQNNNQLIPVNIIIIGPQK